MVYCIDGRKNADVAHVCLLLSVGQLQGYRNHLRGEILGVIQGRLSPNFTRRAQHNFKEMHPSSNAADYEGFGQVYSTNIRNDCSLNMHVKKYNTETYEKYR